MNLLTTVATFAACAGTTLGAMKALQETSNPVTKAAFSNWLLSRDAQDISLVTVPHLLRAQSIGFLGRLGIARLLLAAILFSFFVSVFVLVWLLTRDSSTKVCLACPDDVIGMLSDRTFWSLAGISFILGIPASIASTAKSRAVVASDWFTQNPKSMLVLDFCASITIAIAWVAFLIWAGKRLELDRIGTFAFPTLFTSVAPTLFTLVFVLYAVIIRWLLKTLHLNLRLFGKLLNFAEKPYQSLGCSTAPISGIAGAIAAVCI